MRINRFIAANTGLSRRTADKALEQGHVLVNGVKPQMGYDVADTDVVTLSGRPVITVKHQTIMLNKPAGYVVSRDGQGSRTVYDLLPEDMHRLKAVGRLDKDSSGLLLLTNDGELAEKLTHPKYEKVKTYEITLKQPLTFPHYEQISTGGVTLEDGTSKLELTRIAKSDDLRWYVRMHEGRNRQIRRTFGSLGYNVTNLHRTQFGTYSLPSNLAPGKYQAVA